MAVPPLELRPRSVVLVMLPPLALTPPPQVSPIPTALPALPPLLTSPTPMAPPLADDVATPPLPAEAMSSGLAPGKNLSCRRDWAAAPATPANPAAVPATTPLIRWFIKRSPHPATSTPSVAPAHGRRLAGNAGRIGSSRCENNRCDDRRQFHSVSGDPPFPIFPGLPRTSDAIAVLRDKVRWAVGLRWARTAARAALMPSRADSAS